MSFSGLLVHKCTIQERLQCQKLSFTAPTGTPVVGQTVTGGTSLATGVITRVFTTYLVVKSLVGTFSAGETITIGITFTATFGTQTSYKNQNAEPEYYWNDDQTKVPCRFYISGGNTVLTQTGEIALKPLQAHFLPTTTIADGYRIVTTDEGYAATYDVTVYPKTNKGSLHHIEAVLTKVNSP